MPALNRLTGELLEAEKSETQLDRELLNLRKKLSAALVLRGQLQAYACLFTFLLFFFLFEKTFFSPSAAT